MDKSAGTAAIVRQVEKDKIVAVKGKHKQLWRHRCASNRRAIFGFEKKINLRWLSLNVKDSGCTDRGVEVVLCCDVLKVPFNSDVVYFDEVGSNKDDIVPTGVANPSM